MEALCDHCFCRSTMVACDTFGTKKKRVRYCCWCGEEKKP